MTGSGTSAADPASGWSRFPETYAGHGRAAMAADGTAPRPGLAPRSEAPAHVWETVLTVDGERFLVALRSHDGTRHEYDYAWVSGPNDNYGFTSSGYSVLGEEDLVEAIRGFLAGIDPETGYLADD